ncbi:MAG: hypothetical protein AAF585_14905 [Verrucomicrobiota bacterium]
MKSDSLDHWLEHRRNQESAPLPGGDAFTTSVMEAIEKEPTTKLPNLPDFISRLPRSVVTLSCIMGGLGKIWLILFAR